MSDFVPYADESEVLTLGDLAVENRLDRLTLHGRVELTRDRQGLALARRLKAVLDAAVGALEADEESARGCADGAGRCGEESVRMSRWR